MQTDWRHNRTNRPHIQSAETALRQPSGVGAGRSQDNAHCLVDACLLAAGVQDRPLIHGIRNEMLWHSAQHAPNDAARAMMLFRAPKNVACNVRAHKKLWLLREQT